MATDGKSQSASTFVLGVLIWALTINFLRGGPNQAKGWLKAKFINEPMAKGVSR